MRFLILLLLIGPVSCSQPETAESLLEKSIAYHDPNGVWDSFEGTLEIMLEMPDSSERWSLVSIDRNNSIFELVEYAKQDTVLRYWEPDSCLIMLNGNMEIDSAIRQEKRLTCERTEMYKNYYTYLYGLPMKLRDPGTIIGPEYEKVTFMEKDFLRIRVTYEEAVGKDIWYFYFDPETHALEVYQFYHNETKNDGEYILLSDMVDYNGLKIPKVREWYMNGEEKFLGSDNLMSISN